MSGGDTEQAANPNPSAHSYYLEKSYIMKKLAIVGR